MARIYHRPSRLNLIPYSRDSDPGCMTSSSTISMASLPRTPENPVYGRYAWYNPESPSTDDQLWPPDAVLAGSQEYVPGKERLTRVRKENRFMPYEVSPGLRGDRLPKATHIPDLSPLTGSMLLWGQGAEGLTCDLRLDTYDEGYLGQALSGTPLLATDARLDPTSEDASQYGDPNQIEPIVEHGVPVAEPGCRAPQVAENGVAPRLPQVKLPSAIPSATALGFPAVQKDSAEVSSGTNLIPTANVTFNAQERRRGRGRWVVKPKAKPKRKKSDTEFVCEECTSARGWTVSFNCKKDLRRHQTTTKAHGAPFVLKCSCGTGVTRKDQMRLHQRSCKRHTL